MNKKFNLNTSNFINHIKILSCILIVSPLCFSGSHAYAQNVQNTSYGINALPVLNSGSDNVAFGHSTLNMLTSGSGNTAFGARALQSQINCNDNTALGDEAARNTTGCGNVGVGHWAMAALKGSENVAIGSEAIYFTNTDDGTKNGNVTIGIGAMTRSRAASDTIAIGGHAANFTDGFENTATGYNAHHGKNPEDFSPAIYNMAARNVALGAKALELNVNGLNNVAVGYGSLALHQGLIVGQNSNGSSNVGLGTGTLANLTSGSDNIAVGKQAGQYLLNGNKNIYLGHPGNSSESGVLRIGDTINYTKIYIAGIYGKIVSGGVQVILKPDGQLGKQSSSERYKQNIQDMNSSSEIIHSMRPVQFLYNTDIDPVGYVQYGLIAEEVEELSTDLVIYNKDNQVEGVRYEAIHGMLLNEFQKQHETFVAQTEEIAAQNSKLASQDKEIEALQSQVLALIAAQ